jgi:nitrogen regulatory protein PII
MKNMKKVEVIVESVYMNKLLIFLMGKGVDKYTLIRDIEGKGTHGIKLANDVTDLSSNDYIFTAIEEELYLSFKEELRVFIKRYGGKCFVTDTMMLL